MPLGAQGDPLHPDFGNQADRWAAGELLPIETGWAELAERATWTIDLRPAQGPALDP